MSTALGPTTMLAMLQTVARLHDGGSLCIYSGTRPKSASQPPTSSSNELVVIPYPRPAFAQPQEGMMQAVERPAMTVKQAGKATWFRVTDAQRRTVRDGDIGEDIKLDKTTLQPGDRVHIIEEQLVLPSEES